MMLASGASRVKQETQLDKKYYFLDKVYILWLRNKCCLSEVR